MTVDYHMPPGGYVPPARCEECGEMIYIAPCMGGHKWSHIASYVDHDVVMRPEGWWDSRTGETRYGHIVLREDA